MLIEISKRNARFLTFKLSVGGWGRGGGRGGVGSVLFGGGIPIFILGLGKGSCNKSTCSNQVYTVLLSSKF